MVDGAHLDATAPDTAAPDTAAPDTAVPDAAAPDTAAPDIDKPDVATPDTTATPDGCACATDADCPSTANCQEFLCTQCACVPSAQPDGTVCGAAQTCQQGQCKAAAVWATGVATGDAHGCAVHGTGHVSCWGNNSQLQAGQAKTTKIAQSALSVAGISTAVAASGRSSHTCAVLSDGTLRCWGHNFWGQLGVDNGGDDSATPQNPAITGVQQVAAGGQFTLALRTDGSVWGWGQNNAGQLLDGTAQSSKTPIPVGKALAGGPLKGVAYLCAGSYHACAIDTAGDMWCWGKGDEGQVGNGKKGVTNVVKQPFKLKNVPAMASCSAGSKHTCAVTKKGQLWCWGRNSSGQLGDKTTKAQTVPSWADQVTSVAQVAVGIAHTCVRGKTGAVLCWGRNDRGQVTPGSATMVKASTKVQLTSKAIALSAGREHTCATLDTGAVQCWGRGDQGQTGVGKVADAAVPVTVKAAP